LLRDRAADARVENIREAVDAALKDVRIAR
jgi:hypothetical protein